MEKSNPLNKSIQNDTQSSVISDNGDEVNIPVMSDVYANGISDSLMNAEERKKQEKRETKSLLIAIAVIVGLVVLVIFGVKLYPFVASPPMTIGELHQANLNGEIDSENGLVYNGFSFIKLDGLWWGEVARNGESVHIRLHYNPVEVENVTISGILNKSFNTGTVVYQAINPDVANKYYTLALTELNSNVVQGIGRSVVAGCTREDYICENRTIVACNNTQGLPVIELIPDDFAYVKLEGSCIAIHGQETDLVRAAERVLYQWYGVIQ